MRSLLGTFFLWCIKQAPVERVPDEKSFDGYRDVTLLEALKKDVKEWNDRLAKLENFQLFQDQFNELSSRFLPAIGDRLTKLESPRKPKRDSRRRTKSR